MNIRQVIESLSLNCITKPEEQLLDQEITGGFVSDLLSNVMGKAKSGDLWVTVQAHQNIIAVASLANLSVVIVAGGTKLEAETTARAVKEKVILCTTVLPAFEVVGQLYQLGIKGHDS